MQPTNDPIATAPTGDPTHRHHRARTKCSNCGHRPNDADPPPHVSVPCHVRAFSNESFRVWRCPRCRAIHCLEIVDLDAYYAKYPFAGATLNWPFRRFYAHLARRLRRFGLSRGSSLLDYGCGQGLFVQYLRERGHEAVCGYDPYAPRDATGDRAVLDDGPFDFVLLQDVLEHVEDGPALLSELDGYLAPGGHILIGTPDADKIDLARPHDFLNELHVPYHLHIYPRDAVERMGLDRGWSPTAFFDRPYHDLPYLGLNTRAAKTYQRLCDGTLDAVLEPVRPLRALTSPSFLFNAVFGYWLGTGADMALVFKKTQ